MSNLVCVDNGQAVDLVTILILCAKSKTRSAAKIAKICKACHAWHAHFCPVIASSGILRSECQPETFTTLKLVLDADILF